MELLNLHQVLTNASQSTEKDQPLVTVSFRIDESVKKAADELCQRHGTTLSAFFREAAHQLLREYCPENE